MLKYVATMVAAVTVMISSVAVKAEVEAPMTKQSTAGQLGSLKFALMKV